MKNESSKMEALTIWSIWVMEDANNVNDANLLQNFSGIWASTVDKNFKLKLKKKKGGKTFAKDLCNQHAWL